MPNYEALKIELAAPDLAGLSDLAAASKLMSDVVATDVFRGVIPAREIFEAIAPLEWSAITAEHKARINGMLSMGDVDLSGPNTRATFTESFKGGLGPLTIANIQALQKQVVAKSRAESIEGWGIAVTEHDVAHARNLI